jgi:hypothetical protein
VIASQAVISGAALLAGVAVVGLMSGVAFAQTYIPTSPPSAPPAVGVPGSSRVRTDVEMPSTSPAGGDTRIAEAV